MKYPVSLAEPDAAIRSGSTQVPTGLYSMAMGQAAGLIWTHSSSQKMEV